MKAVLGLFVVLFCAGCTITQSHVSNNTDLTAVDFEELLNQKSGQSCNTVFFGIFPASGDYASVAKAALDAEIKKVSYVETYKTYLFPIMSSECVVVFGE